jgi:hypothetical protein
MLVLAQLVPSFICPPLRLTVTCEIVAVLVLVRSVNAVVVVALPPGAMVVAGSAVPLPRVVTWEAAKTDTENRE